MTSGSGALLAISNNFEWSRNVQGAGQHGLLHALTRLCTKDLIPWTISQYVHYLRTMYRSNRGFNVPPGHTPGI